MDNNICNKNKFLFIHIPKTGGTSIANAVGINGVTRHLTHRELLNRCSSQSEIKNYLSFAFVRNPWDRFLSLYFYLKKADNTELIDFKYFCKLFANDFYISNRQVWSRHYMPQSDYIETTDIKFIGRYENFQDDFNDVCDKIGIPQQKLPHRKKSKHKHYTEYYDEETKQIVAEKYEKDIGYFGYKFGE